MAPQSTQSMDTTFQTSSCRVIPYTEIDGIPTFKDSDVKGFYDRIAKDGLVEFIFHDGYIQTSDDFLMMMKGAGAALYVAYYENDPVGVGWLTHFEAKSRSCRAHFTTFSEVWNKDTVSIGREVFNQMLPYGGKEFCSSWTVGWHNVTPILIDELYQVVFGFCGPAADHRFLQR